MARRLTSWETEAMAAPAAAAAVTAPVAAFACSDPRQRACIPWPGVHRRESVASAAPHRCAVGWERRASARRWGIAAAAVAGDDDAPPATDAAAAVGAVTALDDGWAGRRRRGTACDDTA